MLAVALWYHDYVSLLLKQGKNLSEVELQAIIAAHDLDHNGVFDEVPHTIPNASIYLALLSQSCGGVQDWRYPRAEPGTVRFCWGVTSPVSASVSWSSSA